MTCCSDNIKNKHNIQIQEQIKSLNETEEKIRQLAGNINKLSRKRITSGFSIEKDFTDGIQHIAGVCISRAWYKLDFSI